MVQVAIIQGSSQGIGLALARHVLKHTNLTVVATSRTPQEGRSAILDKLDHTSHAKVLSDRLHTLHMDVQDENSIDKAADHVKQKFGQSLRLLINVSGILLPEKSILKVQKNEILKTFEVNTIGHLLTYKHFVPLLPPKMASQTKNRVDADDPAKGLIRPNLNVLASLSARVGSIGDNGLGGWYSYRSSKTALNQIIVTLQRELVARAAISPTITVALHPGTVAGTTLSGQFVPKDQTGIKPGIHDPNTAAQSLCKVISTLGKDDGGQFLDYKGDPIVW